MGNIINKYKQPEMEIYCTARGIGGKIYDSRPYGNTRQTEYLFLNAETNKFEWLNDNGYCEFTEIKNSKTSKKFNILCSNCNGIADVMAYKRIKKNKLKVIYVCPHCGSEDEETHFLYEGKK